MKSFLFFLIPLTFCPLSQLLYAQPTENKSMGKEFEKTKQLIVMINAESDGTPEFGAGIIVGRKKDELLIATAYHFLHNGPVQADKIQVMFRAKPDKYLQASILKYSDEKIMDLALLSVKNLTKEGIGVCSVLFDRLGEASSLKRGDGVFPLGNPNGASWAMPVVSDKIDDLLGNNISFQSSFITKGNSGGGLLDENAGIAGIVIADQPPFGRAINMNSVISKIKEWGYPVQLHIKHKNGWTKLHVAAREGDLAAIKRLLADCSYINETNEHKSTPLHIAAMYSDTNTMKILMNAGADINALDADGDPPIQWAIDTGKIDNVKLLVKSGADINIQNKDGGNAIWWAAMKRHQEIAAFLIKSGAKVNIIGEQKINTYYGIAVSPLYFAVQFNQKEVVRALIKAGAKVNGNNLVEIAVAANYVEILKMLLEAGASYSLSSVLYNFVSDNKNPSIIQLLADSGANLNSEDGCGYFISSIRWEKPEQFNAFIKAKINVNCKDKYGSSALHVAAQANAIGAIKALIKAGANVNEHINTEKNNEEETPLLNAIRGKSLDGIKILLDAGADINATDKNGRTPIGFANSFFGSYAIKEPSATPYKMIELLTKYRGK